MSDDLQIASLQAAYAAGTLKPADLLRSVHERARAQAGRHVFIQLATLESLLSQLAAAERRHAQRALPLFGVPFAVKDNIDVYGFETTAACPAFLHTPERSAHAVGRLLEAGAVCLGKTNMDQFATGLVGARSPYGACASVFDEGFVSGGSSSGSALAVALGLASFALGTDTAGSGRVPAGFNNIVGLKPSRGVISAHGVVPACQSLDTVSVFAGNAADAAQVFELARGLDPEDPFSRVADGPAGFDPDGPVRFGVPHEHQLEWFGEDESRAAFDRAQREMVQLGGTPVPFDLEPFLEVANLLYAGPWVAERYAAVGAFIESRAEDPSVFDPTVRSIILSGKHWSGADVFRAQYRLEALRRKTAALWREVDVLFLPTTPRAHTIDQVRAEPVLLNAELGRYTNFVNLLDLCGIAVPAGFKASGRPFGVTLLSLPFRELELARLAAHFHDRFQAKVGATGARVRACPGRGSSLTSVAKSKVRVAVVGAHLRGQPLHHELVECHAEFVRETRTAPCYRLFALATLPPKPGLVRAGATAQGILVEVYELEVDDFGRFVQRVPAPLCIGTVELADGSWVKGFLAEPCATDAARDITGYGGWLAYQRRADGEP